MTSNSFKKITRQTSCCILATRLTCTWSDCFKTAKIVQAIALFSPFVSEDDGGLTLEGLDNDQELPAVDQSRKPDGSDLV